MPVLTLPFGMWDGHVHSGWARHGRDPHDTTEAFVLEAVALGLTRITFTEHPLFPSGRIDPELHRAVYLSPQELDAYVRTVLGLRDRFAGRIDVRLGFEVDYVPGDPDFPMTYLSRYAPWVRDAVLSVHFLPGRSESSTSPLRRCGALFPLDVTAEAFRQDLLSGPEDLSVVRSRYWRTVEEAVREAQSWHTGIAWRIGHLDVVGKFTRALGPFDRARDHDRALRTLETIAEAGFALDVNASGIDVDERREVYPEPDLLREAMRLGVPLVYGSDAHRSRDVGRHRAKLRALVLELARDL